MSESVEKIDAAFNDLRRKVDYIEESFRSAEECGNEKDSPSAGRRNVQYQERGKERVSEKEKEILQTMAEALPKMDDMKKGELLGYSKSDAGSKASKRARK